MNSNSRSRDNAISGRSRAAPIADGGKSAGRASAIPPGGRAARGGTRRARGGAAEGRAASPDGGRLRERFRAETREAILGAAEAALAEHGARGAKMDVIAAAAGIAVGTLYNYFDDRQELIDALLELRRSELLGRLDAALEGSRAEPFERQLEAFLGAALTHFQLHRAFIALFAHDELSSASSRWSTMRSLRARAERLIKGGVEAGLLRAEDRAAYPHVLVGLLKGLVETVLETDGLPVTAKLLAPAVRCFLQGARS
jgi:AcrR family transcriptional regulator